MALRDTIKDLLEENGGAITVRTFRNEKVENEEWKINVTETDTELFGVFTNSGQSLQALQQPTKLSTASRNCLISPVDISDIQIGDLIIDADGNELAVQLVSIINPTGKSSEALLYVIEL